LAPELALQPTASRQSHPHRQGREEAVPVGVHCGVSLSFPSPWEVGQHHRIPQERPSHPLRPTSLVHQARRGPVRVPPVTAQGYWRKRWGNAGRHRAQHPAPSSTNKALATRVAPRGGTRISTIFAGNRRWAAVVPGSLHRFLVAAVDIFAAVRVKYDAILP
jgi:hypothetical protein